LPLHGRSDERVTGSAGQLLNRLDLSCAVLSLSRKSRQFVRTISREVSCSDASYYNNCSAETPLSPACRPGIFSDQQLLDIKAVVDCTYVRADVSYLASLQFHAPGLFHLADFFPKWKSRLWVPFFSLDPFLEGTLALFSQPWEDPDLYPNTTAKIHERRQEGYHYGTQFVKTKERFLSAIREIGAGFFLQKTGDDGFAQGR